MVRVPYILYRAAIEKKSIFNCGPIVFVFSLVVLQGLLDPDFGEFQEECLFAHVVEANGDTGIISRSGNFKNRAVAESVMDDGESRR